MTTSTIEKPILAQDIQFVHNGKKLIVGVREFDDSEINMVLGEVLNDTTFDQTWSSGYDRGHISSNEQFVKDIFTPWCNTWIADKYGPFDGNPVEWWALMGVFAKQHMVWNPDSGFHYVN